MLIVRPITRFTLADRGTTSGSSSTITVDFEYIADGQRTAWHDEVVVVPENGRWLIDDVRYLQNSAFGNGFGSSLQGSLKPGGGC
jgi:hypothetical protein